MLLEYEIRRAVDFSAKIGEMYSHEGSSKDCAKMHVMKKRLCMGFKLFCLCFHFPRIYGSVFVHDRQQVLSGVLLFLVPEEHVSFGL